MLNNLRTFLGSPNSSHRGLNSANQTSSKKGKKTAVLSVQVDLEQAFGQPTTVDQDLFVFGGNGVIKLATPPKKPLRIVEQPLQANPISTISPGADPTLVFFRSKTSPPSQSQPESNHGLAAYSGENKVSPQSNNSDPVGANNLPRPTRRKSRTIILQPDTAVSPYSGEDLNTNGGLNRSKESITPIKLRTPSPKSNQSASQERRRLQNSGSGGSQTKRRNGQTQEAGGDDVTSVFSAEKLREQDRSSSVENQRMLTISTLAPLPKPSSRRRTPSPRGDNNVSLVSHVDSPELKVSRPRRAAELPPSSRVFLSAGISGNLHLDSNERKDGTSTSQQSRRGADATAEEPDRRRRNDMQRRRQGQQQQQRELAVFDGETVDRPTKLEETSSASQQATPADASEPVFRVTRRIPVRATPQAFSNELKESRKEAVISPLSSPASSPLKAGRSLARNESSGSTSTSTGAGVGGGGGGLSQSNSPFEMMKKRMNMAKETSDGNNHSLRSKQHHDAPKERTSTLKEAIAASIENNDDDSNRTVRQGYGEDVIVGGNEGDSVSPPSVAVASGSRTSVVESRRASGVVSKEDDLNLLSAEAIRSSLDSHQQQQQPHEPLLKSPKPPSETFLQSVANASPKKTSRRNSMTKSDEVPTMALPSSSKKERSGATMTASLQQQHQQRRQQMTANVSTRRKPPVPQMSRGSGGGTQSAIKEEASTSGVGEQLHQDQQEGEKRSGRRRMPDSNVNERRSHANRERVESTSNRRDQNTVRISGELHVEEDVQQPVLPLRTSSSRGSSDRRRENFIQAGLSTVETFLGGNKVSSSKDQEEPIISEKEQHQKVEYSDSLQSDRIQQQHSPIRPSTSAATSSPIQKIRSSPDGAMNRNDQVQKQEVEVKSSRSPKQQQQEESSSASPSSPSRREGSSSPSIRNIHVGGGGDGSPSSRQPKNVEQEGEQSQETTATKKSPGAVSATNEGSIDTRSVHSRDIRAALESLAQIPSPANAPSPPTVARPSPPFDARKSLESMQHQQQQKASTPPKRAEAERRMASRVREAFEKRKLDETLELCDEWKRLNPRSSEVWYHSGRVHLLRGEVSPSEHHLNNALKLVTSLVKEYDEDEDEYFSKDGGLKQLILRELGKIRTMTNARDECLKDLTKRAGNFALNHVTKAREISPCSAQLCVLRAASLLMATSSPHAPPDEGSESTGPASSRVSPKSQNAFTNELDQAFNLAFDVVSQIGLPATQYARVMHKTGLTSEADSLLEEVCNRAKRGEPLKACVELLRLFRSMESAKADANEAYSQGKFGESIRLFSKALELDPLNDVYNAVILSNRAASYMALGDFAKAVVDCDSALKLVPTFQRARIRRARALLKMNKFRESISDYEMAMRSNPTTSLANELADARKAMKDHQESQKRGFFSSHTFSRHSFSGSSSGATSGMAGEDDFGIPRMGGSGGQLPRPPQPPLGGGFGRRNTIHSSQPAKEDLYKILGVSPSASSADIRKAYHRAALKHHPDKNVGDSEANQRFKKVADAFHTLSDPQRRRTYDLMSSSLSVPMM